MVTIDDSKVVSGTLSEMVNKSLGVLDDLTNMGFGDDNTTTDVSDTTLGNEIIRKVFDETKIKNTCAGTYDFSGLVGLTEANGNTLKETSLQVASSGGVMRLRALLPTEVTKTIDKDLSCGIRIKIEVENI